MATTRKLMVEGSYITSFGTNAEGVVVYYMDLADATIVTPDILTQAMYLAPPIGSIKDFAGVPGAPAPGNLPYGAVSLYARYLHQMRVYNVSVRPPTVNAKKLFVDVKYRSRPRASVESGSSGTQVKTETYLADANGTRKQMTLNWMAQIGAWGKIGNESVPPFTIQYPSVPVTASRMQFGSTFRLSATYYTDEITHANLNALQVSYTTSVNAFPIMRNVGFNDSRLWLCSALNFTSSDQFEFRVSGEWVFSPFGWDSIAVYTSPFLSGNQLAIVSDIALKKVYAGFNDGTRVPSPINEDLAGIARFPQNRGVDHSNLLNFLYQPAGVDLKLLVTQALSPTLL